MKSLQATLVLTLGCLALVACGGSQAPDNQANVEVGNLTVNDANIIIAPPEAEIDQGQATQEAEPKPAAPPKAAAPVAPKRDTSAPKPATAEPKPSAPAKPKTEPAPPASTCTPEHRALGHC